MQVGWQVEGLRRREAGTEGSAAVAATLWVQEPDRAEEQKSEEEGGRFAARWEVALQVS